MTDDLIWRALLAAEKAARGDFEETAKAFLQIASSAGENRRREVEFFFVNHTLPPQPLGEARNA